MRYISLFSGAGGLEHRTLPPILACESDVSCARVLRRRLPGVELRPDVLTLVPPTVEVVVGGWPCQDVSAAGSMTGLDGERSGLFYRMIEVAVEARAHTVVGENVPYLLNVRRGRDFESVLNHLQERGFRFIAWRTLNARQFGLAQDRRRLFIVASKHREIARALHACDPELDPSSIVARPQAAGFYWTAGNRSMCFSKGFVPALKVGASDSKGRSVIAILQGERVWKLSADGCARLQGFLPSDFEGESKTDVVRMAGNAVPVPMGRFVLDLVFSHPSENAPPRGAGIQTGFAAVTQHGLAEDGIIWSIDHRQTAHASNLDEVALTDRGDALSSQAAAGLLVRSVRANKLMPLELFDVLVDTASRTSSLRGARSNSFEELRQLDMSEYRHRIQARHLADAA